MGSVIAECALRFGFEHITIVDGDKVEESNLNRQNYVMADIGKHKAEALCRRLLEINPGAEITSHDMFLDGGNMEGIISGHQLAVNALDFKDGVPFEFDRICAEKKIPVLHPYNLGWAGFLAVVHPEGHRLSELSCGKPAGFELKVAEYAAMYGAFWNMPTSWLEEVLAEYRAEAGVLPPPQLPVASWIVAGYCVNAMFNMATGREVRFFPQFYFSSLMGGQSLL